MDLTVREAAAALGITPRTVRGQAESGKIAAKKRDGRWIIDGARLALGAEAQRALQSRAQKMRSDLDAALPSSVARGLSEKTRSVIDLDAFRLLADVVRHAQGALPDIRALLESALGDLAEAVHVFHTSQKAGPAERARRSVARAVALLVGRSDLPLQEPLATWVNCLEGQVLPAIGGYLKWIEGGQNQASQRGRR